MGTTYCRSFPNSDDFLFTLRLEHFWNHQHERTKILRIRSQHWKRLAFGSPKNFHRNHGWMCWKKQTHPNLRFGWPTLLLSWVPLWLRQWKRLERNEESGPNLRSFSKGSPTWRQVWGRTFFWWLFGVTTRINWYCLRVSVTLVTLWADPKLPKMSCQNAAAFDGGATCGGLPYVMCDSPTTWGLIVCFW